MWYFWAANKTGKNTIQSHHCLMFTKCLGNSHTSRKTKQPHTNDFVYGVMVIKRHKGEASLLPSGAFLHDVNAFNLSILLKVFADVVLLGVLLDAANKDLLHCQMGTWFIRVLKQSAYE